MKNIQKIALSFTLAFTLFFAFSVSSFAQEHEGRHGKHDNHEARLEKMKTELGLSDAQVEQIKALHEKKKEKSKADRKANREEFRAEVNKILTPEQRKKAEALHAEHKDPNKRAEKRVEKWKTELSLSDAQATKVKAALVTKMTKMQALREAAKDKGDDEKVDKIERKAIKTAFETELKSILSSEQFAKYEQIKAEKKGKHGNHKKGKHGQPKREVKDINPPIEH
ncbi:Spy/CpxP family protein refolding chaperone [Bernardetia sp. OM2101]|uniref:Spy/CpxP family protein refolding chaperone n=1 Tax=Bernardetia sp. OM2101 TaxID=3344876 RepID=UPI0035D0C432